MSDIRQCKVYLITAKCWGGTCWRWNFGYWSYITALTCECHRFVESIVRVLGALRNYLGLVVVTEVRFVVQWGAGSRSSAGWVGSAHFVLLLVRPVITLIVDISCLRNRQPPPPHHTQGSPTHCFWHSVNGRQPCQVWCKQTNLALNFVVYVLKIT